MGASPRHTGDVQPAVDALIRLLDLEAIEVNIFRGAVSSDDRPRIFGGQVAGQALVAAVRTVDREFSVHSLHSYFLRPGDPEIPVLYEVDRIRDGRSFVTRRVVGIQHGKAIFNLAASFHKQEDGYEHADQMPPTVDPETLPTRQELLRDVKDLPPGWRVDDDRPIDTRWVTKPPWDRADPQPPDQQMWFRADGSLPDDPVLHTCMLTYASDMSLLDTTLLPHGRNFIDGSMMMASLDHAMWFHAPFRADEWMLYEQHTPFAGGARGLATAKVFSHDGRLIATVVQEGLIRPITK